MMEECEEEDRRQKTEDRRPFDFAQGRQETEDRRKPWKNGVME